MKHRSDKSEDQSESSQYGLRMGLPSSSTHRPFTKQEDLKKRMTITPRRNNIFSVQKLYKQTQNLMQNILKVDEEPLLTKKDEQSKSTQKRSRKDRSYLKQFNTRNMFGVTLPDYSSLKKKKIQQYFKDPKEIDQESSQFDQELKKAMAQQDSTMKIKKFLKDSTVPEDQKRRLHRLLVKNEKILEVYKQSDCKELLYIYKKQDVQIMNSEKLQKRLIFSRSPEYRKPIYEEGREQNTYSRLYYKTGAISYRNEKQQQQQLKRRLEIQSENVSQSEDTEHDFSLEVFNQNNDSKNLPIQDDIGEIVQGLKKQIITNQPSQYFSYLKNADKIKDLSEYFKVCDQADPMIFFSTHQDVFPKKLFVNQQVLANQVLDFSNYKLGKYDIQILTSLLQQNKQVKSLKLQNDQITPEILQKIINYISLNIKLLNISDNQLGRVGCDMLKQIFIPCCQKLKILNLSNNNIGDSGVIDVLSNFESSNSITHFDFSRNNLSDQLAPYLSSFLVNNHSLEQLILRWNQLGSQVGVELARALLQNKTLRVLDMSYNSMGINQQSECIQDWCLLITNQNTTLNHLDFAYNQFSFKQLKRLGTALKNNMDIYGFHCEGNQSQAYVDPYGFLKFSNNEKTSTQKTQPINGINYIVGNQNQVYNEFTDCCWICQGWQEIEFQYKPGPIIDGPIFLHLDFLDFYPILMISIIELKKELQQMSKGMKWEQICQKEIVYTLREELGEKFITIQDGYGQDIPNQSNQNNNYFATFKMCPPKRRIYFFFSNPLLEQQFIDENYSTVSLSTSGCKFTNKEIQFLDGNKYKLQSMKNINYIDTKQSLILNEEKNYKPFIRVLPRMQERKYSLKKLLQNQIKTKKNFSSWQISQSVFKEYQVDSRGYLDSVFEFDWNCSKIQRFIRNDADRRKVRDLIKEIYPLLKTLYKLNSQIVITEDSLQTQESFGVPFQNFIKLLTQNQIIEGELKQNDVEINLVSIKTNIEQKFTYNSDRALIRYQFIEMFFRISNDKYMRLQQSKTYSEALQKLIQQDIEPRFKNIDDPQKWREQRFWNKECDNTLKLKLPFILKLFDSVNDFSTQKRYLTFKWVSCKDFVTFIGCINLSAEHLNDREAIQIYSLSMQTQIDEVTQDRHQRMNLSEFMEALARIAEKISPCPIGQSLEKWTVQQRQCLPLHVKLESLLCYIYKVYKLPGVEKFEHFMKSDDPILSVPTQNFKIKQFQIEIDSDKKEILDSIYYPQEGCKKILSIVGVLAYIECFKQPYVLPHYPNYFDEKFEAIRSIAITPKPKKNSKKKSPTKQKKKSPIPQEVIKFEFTEPDTHQLSEQSQHDDDMLQDL